MPLLPLLSLSALSMEFVKRRGVSSSSPLTAEEEEEEDLDTKRRDWPSLTPPLLLAVLRRLDSLEDFFAFRGVCRAWRSAAAPSVDSLAGQPPLLLLTRFPSYTEAFFDLPRRRLYRFPLPWCVHSRRSLAFAPGGHLVTATHSPKSKILLWSIFTQSQIRLPTAPLPFRRVLLSSDPVTAGHHCVVLLFSKGGSLIQYSRIGDSLWTIRDSDRSIEDMIFFRDGNLYALTATMQLLVADLSADLDFHPLRDGCAPAPASVHYQQFLAEAGGDLLVLCHRFPGGFDVFRWDFKSGRWVEALDLGGRAVFLGSTGFAGSIATGTGLGIRGDCIYYVGRRKDAWYVFSMEEQTIEVLSPDSPGLLKGESAMETVWVLPSLC